MHRQFCDSERRRQASSSYVRLVIRNVATQQFVYEYDIGTQRWSGSWLWGCVRNETVADLSSWFEHILFLPSVLNTWLRDAHSGR
jgi:hypothetical protein